MELCTLALAVLVFYAAALRAEAPEVEWFTGHGTDYGEHVHEGSQTRDGGYIAIGHGSELAQALVIKVDEDGGLEWQKTFGGVGNRGVGYCVSEVLDGYVVGGSLYDSRHQRMQRFLAKLDRTGHTVWEEFYAAPGIGAIRGIDITADGGIAATGFTRAPDTDWYRDFVFIADEGSGFLMKTDAEGRMEWEEPVEATQGTKVREIAQGYAVCSSVWDEVEATENNQDFCLINTDSRGHTLWRKRLGGDRPNHLYDFDLTTDGGYILGGHTRSYGVENWDYLLMKVDRSGTEEWHKVFGQPRGYDARYIHDEAYGVRQTPDGGYIIAGGSGDEYESYHGSGHSAGPSHEWKVYLVKTDGEGNVLWQGIYPTAANVGNNAGEYIGLTSDGGYIVFVDTDSQTPPAPNNFGFLKLAPDR